MELETSCCNLDDHLERCRFCLTLITDNENFFDIDEVVKNRFENLTSLDLSIDSLLSSIICFACDRIFKKFNELRNDFIQKQLKLCEYVNINQQESLDNEIQEDFIEEDISSVNHLSHEYLNEEEINTELTEPIEVDEESSAQIEFLVTEDDDGELCSHEQNSTEYETLPDSSKKVNRPRAWTWSHDMELDLIKYYNAFKTEKTSQNSVFERISRKFEQKNYPKISGKSIKYKYEKLLNDTERLRELEEFATNSEPTDEENLVTNESKPKRLQVTKKRLNRWNDSMEVLLLHLMQRVRCEQPAISDNALFRRIAKEMLMHGHSNCSELNIVYHLKKMKRNKEKFERLMKKSKDLKVNQLSLSSKQYEQQEEIICNQHRASTKRSYLHWNESMKEALLRHRSDLVGQVPAKELWSSISRKMQVEGHGRFTPRSLFHKYYNVRRDKKKIITSVVDQDDLVVDES